MNEYNIVKGSHLNITVLLAAFHKNWCEFKGDLPLKMPVPTGNTITGSDMIRMQVKQASLFEVMFAHAQNIGFEFTYFMHTNPAAIRTTCKIPTGTLQLPPFTELRNMRSTSGVAVQFGADTFHFIEQCRPRGSDSASWRAGSIFSPDWWVGTCSDAKSANMKEKVLTVSHNDGTITFTVHTNSRILQPGEALIKLSQKRATAAPLADTELPHKRARH